MQLQPYTGLILGLAILVLPLLANLYFKIPDFKRVLTNFLKTYSVAGLGILFLNSFILERGDWSIASRYLSKINIGIIPVEFFLFFFAVPFAGIVLYEIINLKYKEKRIALDNSFFYLFAFTFFALSIITANHSYTTNVFFLNGVLMLVVSYFKNANVFLTKNFYIFTLLSLIPFIIIDAILTMTPILTYKSASIIGFKVGSLAIEDFFLIFFLGSAFLTVYYLFKKKN